jgi:hypothetical protein
MGCRLAGISRPDLLIAGSIHADSRRILTAGTPDDLKASVAAAREAVELLRKLRPAVVSQPAQKRGLAEREAVILDKTAELAQALYNYDSAASHTDPPSARHRLDTRERRPRPRHRDQPGPAHLRPHLIRNRAHGPATGNSLCAK